ncbi:MAG: glycosyltransferase [Kurthia sp.]|nr:glycosyltransferase [Candidatus Kurthia equi]
MVILLIVCPFVLGVFWIAWNSRQLPILSDEGDGAAFISVLIPLRNEQQQVTNLVTCLKKSHYERVEYILYDDDSTDQTASCIKKQITGDKRFQLLSGKGLPEGWKGKPHACQQLACAATGDLLLWLDADVRISPQTIGKVAVTMEKHQLDALSGFPRFIHSNWLESVLTPLLHFFIFMHLPIKIANNQSFLAATAASGAFIAIRNSTYQAIGGHEAVKNEVIEDVTLMYKVKQAGYRAFLLQITEDVSCSMYSSVHATWQGFEKNCFKAFKESYVVAIAIIIFYLLYYVAPLFIAIYAIWSGQWIFIIPLACVTMQRMISDIHAKQLSGYSLVMPVSASMYCTLLIVTMYKRKMHKKTLWKGREV